MLEPRVVAARPTSFNWMLDLSYESDSLNLEQTVDTAPIQDSRPRSHQSESLNLGDTVDTALVQNNIPPVSTNAEDDFTMVTTENEKPLFNTEDTNNQGTMEHQEDAQIDAEFLELARTLQSLGRDRVQEMVVVTQSKMVTS
jgi:hypothetical protein